MAMVMLGICIAPASAATFATYDNDCGDGCTTIVMTGDIEKGDDVKFDTLIKFRGIDRAVVNLNSQGGYIYPMLNMAYRIS
jgi:hypothetical protein